MSLAYLLIVEVCAEIARVENLEEELVALLAILTHKGREVLHRRCLDGCEAVVAENLGDSVEYVGTTSRLNWRKISCSLWNRWFLCHKFN